MMSKKSSVKETTKESEVVDLVDAPKEIKHYEDNNGGEDDLWTHLDPKEQAYVKKAFEHDRKNDKKILGLIVAVSIFAISFFGGVGYWFYRQHNIEITLSQQIAKDLNADLQAEIKIATSYLEKSPLVLDTDSLVKLADKIQIAKNSIISNIDQANSVIYTAGPQKALTDLKSAEAEAKKQEELQTLADKVEDERLAKANANKVQEGQDLAEAEDKARRYQEQQQKQQQNQYLLDQIKMRENNVPVTQDDLRRSGR
jgi:hypothetical protein